MIDEMAESLSLSTLLSQSLVAFTIEFDNESEHQLAHRTSLSTSAGDRAAGPWLTSQVMWSNVMRYVGDEGVRIADLHEMVRTTRDSLSGLQRWGYVIVEPGVSQSATRPRRSDLVVRPTAAGRRARAVWEPLGRVVEQRWSERFGSRTIDDLRSALLRIVDQLEMELPDYLPIVYPTQNGKAEVPSRTKSRISVQTGRTSESDLSGLLSKHTSSSGRGRGTRLRSASANRHVERGKCDGNGISRAPWMLGVRARSGGIQGEGAATHPKGTESSGEVSPGTSLDRVGLARTIRRIGRGKFGGIDPTTCCS